MPWFIELYLIVNVLYGIVKTAKDISNEWDGATFLFRGIFFVVDVLIWGYIIRFILTL